MAYKPSRHIPDSAVVFAFHRRATLAIQPGTALQMLRALVIPAIVKVRSERLPAAGLAGVEPEYLRPIAGSAVAYADYGVRHTIELDGLTDDAEFWLKRRSTAGR